MAFAEKWRQIDHHAPRTDSLSNDEGHLPSRFGSGVMRWLLAGENRAACAASRPDTATKLLIISATLRTLMATLFSLLRAVNHFLPSPNSTPFVEHVSHNAVEECASVARFDEKTPSCLFQNLATREANAFEK